MKSYDLRHIENNVLLCGNQRAVRTAETAAEAENAQAKEATQNTKLLPLELIASQTEFVVAREIHGTLYTRKVRKIFQPPVKNFGYFMLFAKNIADSLT